MITPVPLSTEADAQNRGWRTLVQGLAVDVGVAVVLAVGPVLIGSDFAWTRGYWLTLAGLAGRSAVMALVSYVTRKLIPPPGR